MNDQSTATDTSAEPKLCRMGCGFFGSNATGDCCSKCWNSRQKKDETCTTASSTPTTEASTAMEVDTVQCSPAPTPVAAAAPTEPQVLESSPMETEDLPVVQKKSPKKKKKKSSYKSMMAGMTQRSKDVDTTETDKANLRKGVGGGNFTKVDKI